MNSKFAIIGTLIIACIIATAYIADHYKPMEQSNERYTYATSTEQYVISVDIAQTGVSEIDESNKTDILSARQEIISMATTAEPVVAPYELSVTSQEYHDSQSNFSSQVLNMYQYTGGAHGLSAFMTWNYNEETGGIYDLRQIIDEGDESLAYLYQQVQEMSQIYGTDTEWVESGSGMDWSNYQLFYIKEEGMTIIFPQYQIAPYAAGVIELDLSWEELQPYLRGGVRRLVFGSQS